LPTLTTWTRQPFIQLRLRRCVSRGAERGSGGALEPACPVSAGIGGGFAGKADAPAFTFDGAPSGVSVCELVASSAELLRRVNGASIWVHVIKLEVDALGCRLQVSRIAAVLVSASMVQDAVQWRGADQEFVDHPMRLPSSASQPDNAVAFAADVAGPEPAAVGRLSDASQKPARFRKGQGEDGTIVATVEHGNLQDETVDRRLETGAKPRNRNRDRPRLKVRPKAQNKPLCKLRGR